MATFTQTTFVDSFMGGGGGVDLSRFKGILPRDFSTSSFFHEAVSPQAPESPIQPVSNFFQQFAEIFTASSRCATIVVDASGKFKKIFDKKIFKYFLWTSLGSRVNIQNFFFNFTLRCKQSDIVPIICQWHQRCSGNFTASWYREANFPPVV